MHDVAIEYGAKPRGTEPAAEPAGVARLALHPRRRRRPGRHPVLDHPSGPGGGCDAPGPNTEVEVPRCTTRLTRSIGRYSAAELDRLRAQREQAVIERRRARHAHLFVLPDVTEIRPQLAEDIAGGDDFSTAQCRAANVAAPS